jgi:type IV secretory pathway protease TraF
VTKRVNRPHKRAGRPLKRPPPNAAARIEALAATGHSVVGIARGLNTSKDRVARWIETDPSLAEALARGRESERFALHNALYRAAMRGNIVAAMFLLKARHGYREGDQSEAANRVSINFSLPGAMTVEDFKGRVISHEPITEAVLVSGKSLTRS